MKLPLPLFPDARQEGSRALAAAVAGVAAGLFLWRCWCAFPASYWNELRVAPAFALRFGFPLYPGLDDGPLSTWIYGPVGAVVNLPATFASSAAGAVLIAGVINIVMLVGPMIAVCLNATELRMQGWKVQLLALALCILLLPVFSLTFQVADHSSIAFGLLSCWF